MLFYIESIMPPFNTATETDPTFLPLYNGSAYSCSHRWEKYISTCNGLLFYS
jgi:hypothetical protein